MLLSLPSYNLLFLSACFRPFVLAIPLPFFSFLYCICSFTVDSMAAPFHPIRVIPKSDEGSSTGNANWFFFPRMLLGWLSFYSRTQHFSLICFPPSTALLLLWVQLTSVLLTVCAYERVFWRPAGWTCWLLQGYRQVVPCGNLVHSHSLTCEQFWVPTVHGMESYHSLEKTFKLFPWVGIPDLCPIFPILSQQNSVHLVQDILSLKPLWNKGQHIVCFPNCLLNLHVNFSDTWRWLCFELLEN